ncbi:MAG: Protease HtpX-like protein [Candidatus Falkowbacteria bacterium GW2011_GWC2_38_22]|uniref:Protease HtpX homolog n=1 Tax=Candidatus Falkowbacteria bacterium GW2011_GWE1_38_31 TaxID=1618638 RepID=A0A0G0JUI3_9BACT|nr:MAG: Protease HtpX-like protein [Candidatus Falkowbacteria bacterium GW2011_GWF2_38_1205]KKQ61534.1 MAG: Protease HtpX-like protein [Candidatus Falkowbacteria bacterium GW2011_GWC2_38_22]KKQ63573.1 MAG: Protease HtpX-like protein [Candidatus Falkowbacteria bacterium GW2011_GWF1_38_22]KKQ65725.1 MAG: Protease HtpX-like protein [Candidatus Falkowbacteria bacterium GW2011_GWE2_38_254]KKQ70342.1 MAG: Protease HtpX-like protein [Candidatus Falkowbacteria bacterium GW2011_GWE1_38_31]KKQ72847.1 MA
MPTLYNHSDSNKRKTWLLLSGFFVFIMLAGFVFGTAMDSPEVLYFAVAFSIVSSFISYWWSDKIVLAMSDAKQVSFEDNKELYRLVENLCITAGLPVPKIYIINDTAPNAFATGRDPEHAVVAVTAGLLQKLDKSELEGVIAHELSHIGNRDILLATIVTVLVGVIVLLADWFRRWTFWGRKRNSEGGGQLQVVIMIAAVLLSILAPFFAYMMQFAISRKREFAADADGALLTRYPEGLARALEKISADTEPLEVANRATAHLYIASPFEGKSDERDKKSFFKKAFMTHPPVEERIAALRGIEI